MNKLYLLLSILMGVVVLVSNLLVQFPSNSNETAAYSNLELIDTESFKKMFNQSTHLLREQLMQISGFGPETVDTILLYGGQRPTFIVDSYTRRILERHSLISPRIPYDEIQTLFHRSLKSDPAVFNEYHALLVKVGKTFCKKGEPDCYRCPLKTYLPSNPNNKLAPKGNPGNMT